MKKERIRPGIVQGLFFNIIIIILFIFLIVNYIYPEIVNIEEKKENLNNLQLENENLLKKGLNYLEFKKLFLKNNSNNSEYLNNLLNNSIKDLKDKYEINLINNGSGSYESFIKEKEKEIKNKELSIKDSRIKEKIEKILPYYKNNSAINEAGITDFQFVNYIEKIIHNFGLEYNGSIGIGELKKEEDDNFSNKKNNKSNYKNQSGGEIYSFNLPLSLTGKKKNIIDFLYYIENVGSIYFTKNNEDIEIKKINSNRYFFDKNGNKIRNDFFNLSRYFPGNNDIFNNIVCEIKSIKLKDYIDSSLDPISYDKGETFINYIKNDQANEKYKIDIELKFYVKGLEIFKTKKYIKSVILRYKNLSKTIISAIKYGKNNKTKLTNRANYSLKQLIKYNGYLISISKNIKDLSNEKKINSDIGNIYKQAQGYNQIFDTISNSLKSDLKNISENLYKKFNDSKKEKND